MKQNLSSINTTKACQVYIRSTQHFCIRAAQQKLASSFAVASNSTPVHCSLFKQKTPEYHYAMHTPLALLAITTALRSCSCVMSFDQINMKGMQASTPSINI
uniref:Uncharacterized protein n=1 Tax=Arundo donax TaxID=35708 RepID=A0A0A9H9D7_ARUDO